MALVLTTLLGKTFLTILKGKKIVILRSKMAQKDLENAQYNLITVYGKMLCPTSFIPDKDLGFSHRPPIRHVLSWEGSGGSDLGLIGCHRVNFGG